MGDFDLVLFGMVSGVGRGIGVLDRCGHCQRGRDSLRVNFWHTDPL